MQAAVIADWLFSTTNVAEGESPNEPNATRRLILLAQSGDLAAFDRLMETHAALALRTATHLLIRPQDADDAAQEIFLRLFRSLRQFDARRPLEPWLYRIAVNVCRTFNRRTRLIQVFSLDSWLEAGGAEPAGRETGAESRDLERALQSLPERERQAVVLREIEGLSAAEAGAILGVQAATVRSQAARGRARLRKLLEGNQ